MSFAAEMKQVVSSPEYKGDSSPAPKESASIDPTPEFSLPSGDNPVVPPPPKPQPPPSITIGDKSFSDPQEAIQYARELQARVSGMNEAIDKIGSKIPTQAAPTEQKPPEPDFFEEVEQDFYADPKAALRKVYEKAKADAESSVFDRYDKMTAAEKQQAQNAENYKNFKQSIYTDAPELGDFDEIVETTVIPKLMGEIGNVPLAQAKERIIEEARKLLKIRKEALATTTELPDGPAITPSPGGSKLPVVEKPNTENSMSFVSQIKQINKRGK